MSADGRQRAREKIARLAAEPGSLADFWCEASAVLHTVVPHLGMPCCYTVDPASLLITSHYNSDMRELPLEALVLEYAEDNVNQIIDVARSASGVSTLYEATKGNPSSSPRWQFNIGWGDADQELVAALRTAGGATWGALGIYRERGQKLFDGADKQFVQDVSRHLADGVRRSLLFGEATDPEGPHAPGLLVLSRDGHVESTTPGVEEWLADFPDGDFSAGRLPSAVVSVAGQVLRSINTGQPADLSMARVLTRSGSWVVLHGATLRSQGNVRVAVIIEPAHPARITQILMDAYALTDREQAVTRQVLQGSSTTEIAVALVLSEHTVQQHLKNIFDKTHVRSRRELVGKVFFAHYEPRVRDNEKRAELTRPLRGGPALLSRGDPVPGV